MAYALLKSSIHSKLLLPRVNIAEPCFKRNFVNIKTVSVLDKKSIICTNKIIKKDLSLAQFNRFCSTKIEPPKHETVIVVNDAKQDKGKSNEVEISKLV